jgi:hypothetical protein
MSIPEANLVIIAKIGQPERSIAIATISTSFTSNKPKE